jgi:uncharacterized membrane protein YeaQ/YmgE (transglycosylase-associated protein family)
MPKPPPFCPQPSRRPGGATKIPAVHPLFRLCFPRIGRLSGSFKKIPLSVNLPDLVSWLLLGLLAGAIARALVPGDDRSGCLVTIVLGIAGAFVGGWLGRYVGILTPASPRQWVPAPGSILTAIVGAIVLLSLLRFVRR